MQLALAESSCCDFTTIVGKSVPLTEPQIPPLKGGPLRDSDEVTLVENLAQSLADPPLPFNRLCVMSVGATKCLA